ncbi:MAG: DUF2240 family protein [Promethearchaeota archaeon]
MNFEDFILTIIKNTGLSRKEIFQMIEKKKKEFIQINSDELALMIIAKELYVDFK